MYFYYWLNFQQSNNYAHLLGEGVVLTAPPGDGVTWPDLLPSGVIAPGLSLYLLNSCAILSFSNRSFVT